MAINEVFPNPTVKQVLFQIRFPNLFYMEDRIGEYQQHIMEEFPESNLVFQRNLLIADLSPHVDIADIQADPKSFQTQKVWNFKSPKGVELNVHTNSVDISSNFHKTYNNPQADCRFRDVIELAIGKFLEVTNIPVIPRIGLRYIDECPVVKKENNAYRDYYETTFPLERFPISDAIQLSFIVRTKRNGHFLNFRESFTETDGQLKLILDFDGYAQNVKPENYLSVTDELHSLILREYEASIKEPVLSYMRKSKETR